MASGKTATGALKYALFFIVSIFLLSVSIHTSYTQIRELYNRSQHPISHPRKIHLKTGTLDTRVEKDIQHDDNNLLLTLAHKAFSSALSFIAGPSMTITLEREKSELRTFMFHLDPAQKDQQDAIRATFGQLGIKIGHYIPHNTYLATATLAQAKQAKKQLGSRIIWIGEMSAEQKLPDERLLRSHVDKHALVDHSSSWSEEGGERQSGQSAGKRRVLEEGDAAAATGTRHVEFTLLASVAKHESKEQLESHVRQWEQEMRSEIPSAVEHLSLVVVSSQKIALGVRGKEAALHVSKWLSKKGLVHWVEIKPPTITHNKYASMLVQSYEAPVSKPLWNIGLTGKNQRIGVGDTGCDYYHCMFYDEKTLPPFQRNQKPNTPENGHRKFIGFWSFMDAVDSENGHGSHVSGSAAGNPHPSSDPSVLEYSAVAKDAKFAFLDCGCDTDGGCICPADTQCECDLKPNRKCVRKFGVVYLPLDLNEGYFPWFYSKGVRVNSNSWGTGYYRDFSFGYSTSSAEIDQFVWEHQDFLPVFAAGNSGSQLGYASLTSESESKNALIVGASMSTLDSFQATANFTDYTRIVERIKAELYQAYCLEASSLYDTNLCELSKRFDQTACCNDAGKCAAKGGLSSQCCGNQDYEQFPSIGFRCCPHCIGYEMSQQPEHFNPNNLALFTARGPTLDGRVKPDVVTVGDKILSARSRGTVEGNKCSSAQGPADSLLKREGTSMAAPIAASAAVLVRQFFEDGYYPSGRPVPGAKFSPSAALVKATLIHSAQQLTGFIYLMTKHLWWPLQYKPGHRFSLRQAYLQGFGHIELSKVLAHDAGLFVPNTVDRVISTGEAHSYCFNARSHKPFRITLVWSDAPSSPAAKINLVNDLDLIVVSPSKKLYYGNGLASSIGQTREEPDFLNNVEQILFTDTVPGHYQVIVRGLQVPSGKQPYALVLSGDMDFLANCPSVPAGLLSEVHKFQNLAYAFGVLSVVAIPALSLVALYFYIQYKRITEGAMGYRHSHAARSEEGEYIDAGDGDQNMELYALQEREQQVKASGEKSSAVVVVRENQ